MSNLLRHITLLTGDIATHRIDTFAPDVVDACAELLPTGGKVPGFDAFKVEIAGRNFFTIWRGQVPILTCGIGQGCEDRETWDALAQLQSRFGKVKGQLPKNGNWLAVALLPPISTLTKSDVSWLADFERCLAAAIMRG